MEVWANQGSVDADVNGIAPGLVYEPETINFLGGFPAGYVTNTLARYTGRVYIATSGTYTFYHTVDDRVKYYFDGVYSGGGGSGSFTK